MTNSQPTDLAGRLTRLIEYIERHGFHHVAISVTDLTEALAAVEDRDRLLDLAPKLAEETYNTGYQHGLARSRTVVTDDGLIDGADAVRDHVRSRISNGDVGGVVERAAREAFDMSYARARIEQEFISAAHEMQRPSVLFKPTISADGDQWCVLLGGDLQIGVCGFGKTPQEAMAAFDLAFWKGETPAAVRAGRKPT